jgi:hypothetical protein
MVYARPATDDNAHFSRSETDMRTSFSAATLCGALAFAATSASAFDFPAMKAGLWESTVMREGAAQKLGTTRMCMDAAVQKEMMDMRMGTMKSMCQKNDIRRDGNKVYSDSECKLGDSTMKASSVTVFTGDTAYHVESKSTYDPPKPGIPSGKMTIDGKWAGACPAGMRPGDVVLADGRKVNMRAIAEGQKGAAPKK